MHLFLWQMLGFATNCVGFVLGCIEADFCHLVDMYFAFFVDLQDVRSFATVQFQKFRSECLFLLCQLSNFWVTYQISKVDKLLDKNVTNICQS